MCFLSTSSPQWFSLSLARGYARSATQLSDEALHGYKDRYIVPDIFLLEQRGLLSYSFSFVYPKANSLWPFFTTQNQNGLSPGTFPTRIYLQAPAHASQRLARFLDRPLFPWKNLIVGFSVAQYLFEGFLSLRQYRVLKQTRPPKVLKNEVSQEVFDKSQVCKAYSILAILAY